MSIVSKWKENFELEDHIVNTQAIFNEQVLYPDDLELKEFIGINTENGISTIYHTRELTEEDVVHELLHLKHPEKSEEWVVDKTNKIINGI